VVAVMMVTANLVGYFARSLVVSGGLYPPFRTVLSSVEEWEASLLASLVTTLGTFFRGVLSGPKLGGIRGPESFRRCGSVSRQKTPAQAELDRPPATRLLISFDYELVSGWATGH
jgi:hypothetical protein